MTISKIITLYTFDELPTEKAKEAARQWYRDGRGPEDFDTLIEDAATILGMLGVTLRYHDVPLCGGGTRKDPNIYWQVGYCQSDGAVFEGTYTYAKGAHRKIREHAPQDTELHRIADALLEIQKRYGYKLYATVRNRQHLEGEIEVDVDHPTIVGPTPEDRCAVDQLMDDLCRWIYDQLRTEDEYQNADEQVDDNIRGNDYTFTAAGDREDP